jgi:uncharacterized protein YciI
MVVVRLRHGSRWDASVGPRGQLLWPEHAAFMDGLFTRGVLELAGPLAGDGGALVLVRSGSADEVREWFAADPWSVHDVCPVTEVIDWTIYLDGRG